MNKWILFTLLITITFTSCSNICIEGSGIGYNEDEEGHGSFKITFCEEENIVQEIEIENITLENISSNITIPVNITKEENISVLDLRP